MARLSGLIAFFVCGIACGDPHGVVKASSDGMLARWLQHALKSVVDDFSSKYPDLAMSVAWKDSENDITLAFGEVSSRRIQPHDTFLYGSGTKPVTAAAVLRLI